jgi:hypothetical protein
MNQVLLILFILLLAYFLFVSIIVIIGTLLFPVLANDELENDRTSPLKKRKR